MLKFGIDRFVGERQIRLPIHGKRVALLAHPASVTSDFTHSLDAIAQLTDIKLTAAFGPQHGLKGDKQDNMVESETFIDPNHHIPVYSLYGEVRVPKDTWMTDFDVLLVDLQDLGCRIYTFITTLKYVIEACAKHKKTIWILDRPNPIGRPIEGLLLRNGWESFVGAGPMPMRHGMTMGEMARWFIAKYQIDVDFHVVNMEGWDPTMPPYFGWPMDTHTWINPSPNAPNLWMARCYAGTVMLEGTTLSEGRGTTRPLELFGAPDLNFKNIIKEMVTFAPQWLNGCVLRECWFEPTFHKHAHQLCHGIQIHVENSRYYNHLEFQPWRLQALAFKAIRRLYPDYALWRDFPYEYEFNKLAIDVINGSTLLREWVDDNMSEAQDLETLTLPDEAQWENERAPFLLYPQ